MIAYNAVIATKFTDEGTTEPVTLSEVKDWLRVDISDDDTLLTSLIKSSRQRLEKYSFVSFIDRTVTARLHNGLGDIPLPYGPIDSLVTITDMDGVAVGADYYDLRGIGFKSLDTDYEDDVIITYSVIADVTEEMRTDLLNQVAYAYENRGDAGKPKLCPNLDMTYKILI